MKKRKHYKLLPSDSFYGYFLIFRGKIISRIPHRENKKYSPMNMHDAKNWILTDTKRRYYKGRKTKISNHEFLILFKSKIMNQLKVKE